MKHEVKLVAAVLVAVAAVAGCATTGGKMTPEEKVAQTLNQWKTATEANDLEGMMAVFSEDFRGDDGGKPEMREFIGGAIEEGMLEGAQMDLESAEIVVADGLASAEPVYLSSNRGSITMNIELKEDPDGEWRISAMETF